MTRAAYPEHQMVATPEVVHLCKRCKGALVFRLPATSPPFYQCQRCGNDEPGGVMDNIGTAFIRLDVVKTLIRKGRKGRKGLESRPLLTLEVALEALVEVARS